MKRTIVSGGAFLLIGSAASALAWQPGYPQAQRDIVEAGMRIVLNHPQADWTGVGGPDGDEAYMDLPASARARSTVLVPKDETLPPMQTSQTHPPEPGDKDGPLMNPSDGRSAEEMRANSAWAQHGGMSGYQGVGGPEVDEAERTYPPCRSRSDDRCQQGR